MDKPKSSAPQTEVYRNRIVDGLKSDGILKEAVCFFEGVTADSLNKPFRIRLVSPGEKGTVDLIREMAADSRRDEPVGRCLGLPRDLIIEANVARYKHFFKAGFVLVGEVYEEKDNKWNIAGSTCFYDTAIESTLGKELYSQKFKIFTPVMVLMKKLYEKVPRGTGHSEVLGHTWNGGSGFTNQDYRNSRCLTNLFLLGGLIINYLGGTEIYSETTSEVSHRFAMGRIGTETIAELDPRPIEHKGERPFKDYGNARFVLVKFPVSGLCQEASVLQTKIANQHTHSKL